MTFLSLIIKNLLRRKVRTGLTCIGIAIAIGVMVTLVGISNGFESSTLDSFNQHGADVVVIEAGKPDQLNSDLDENLADKIEKVRGVKAVAPGLVVLGSVKMESGSAVPTLIIGWRPDSFQFKSLSFIAGRPPEDNGKNEVIIGTTMAATFRKKVGDTIEIQEEPFEVVGMHKSSTFENGAMIMPLSALQRIEFRRSSVSGFEVAIDPKSGVSVEAVSAAIQAIKGERRKRVSAQPTQVYVQGSMHIRLAHAMAWLTSIIAIISGSISTLNTMSMSVFERFREIGTLRAIGWSRSRIVRMVMGESIILSVASALFAIVASIVVLQVLSTMPVSNGFIDGTVAPLVLVQALVVAMLVGIFGGMIPAYRAARLLPTEALRYE